MDVGQVFESCTWSMALSGLTTTFTLHQYNMCLLKQHERVLKKITKLAKQLVTNIQFRDHAQILFEMEKFHSHLTINIKDTVSSATSQVLINPIDMFDEQRIVFEMYDEKCLQLTKSMNFILDGYMTLKSTLLIIV
jgi:hypothetical protein